MSNAPCCIVVGPMKCGTTWLYNYLKFRGDVCLPEEMKETFFFDSYYSRGNDWYQGLFNRDDEHKTSVEVAPTYFHKEGVAERILETLGPETKIICTLRDPAKRLFSHYQHLKRFGHVDLPLRKAFDVKKSMVEASKYYTHLKKWIDHFGKSNVLVVFQEDLGDRPEEFVKKVNDFLEIENQEIPQELKNKINANNNPRYPKLVKLAQRTLVFLRTIKLYRLISLVKKVGVAKIVYSESNNANPQKLNQEDKEWLGQKFMSEIEELEKLIHQDLSHWKQT